MLCDACEVARDGMRAPVAGHGTPAGGKEEHDKRRRRRWNGVRCGGMTGMRDVVTRPTLGRPMCSRPSCCSRCASVALDWASRSIVRLMFYVRIVVHASCDALEIHMSALGLGSENAVDVSGCPVLAPPARIHR
jgi:hypothetical protein